MKDASLRKKGAKEKEHNDKLKLGKKKINDDIASKRQGNLMSMMLMDKLLSMMNDMVETVLDPADVLGPGITGAVGFIYPGASGKDRGGDSTSLESDSGTAKVIGVDDEGVTGSADYKNGYGAGKIAGAKDGQRDGTADATNPSEDDPVALEAKLTILETDDNAVIDEQIAAAQANAYCREIEAQGLADDEDAGETYPECAEYFENADEMEGGYVEDAEGIMQFGGAVAETPAEPSEDYDKGYIVGYQAAYKAAYTQAYSLTIAIQKTGRVKPVPGYGEMAAKAAAAPTTEAAAMGPKMKAKASGAAETSGAVEASGASETSGAQAGGALKRAKRGYKRGRTLSQHSRLINKIRDRTIVA
jgi:hypothetical protein